MVSPLKQHKHRKLTKLSDGNVLSGIEKTNDSSALQQSLSVKQEKSTKLLQPQT